MPLPASIWVQLGLYEWIHLGVALLLCAPVWWAASSLSLHWRQPMRLFALFNLLEGLGVVWGIWWIGHQAWWLVGLANVVLVAAYVVLWRCVLSLTGSAAGHDREQVLLLLVTAVCSLALCLREPAADPVAQLQGFQAVVFLASAWVALRGGITASRRLVLAGAHGLAWGARAVTFTMGLSMALHVLIAQWVGPVLDLEHGAYRRVAYLSMFSAFGLNLLVAYRVFGQELHALSRVMAEANAKSGQYQLSDVEQVLVHEAAVQQQTGACMAVLAMSLHWQLPLPGGQVAHVAASAATLADAQKLLRQRLSPLDVLGQSEDGLIWVCLFNTDQARAQRRAQVLVQALAQMLGHAGPGRTPRVAHGLVLVQPEDVVSTALAVARERCRAQLAGSVEAHPRGGPSPVLT